MYFFAAAELYPVKGRQLSQLRTFDELFECTKALPWEEWIPKDGKVWVTKASTVKSKLYSSSDIQSIMKKAIVKRLKSAYHTEVIPETGASYPVRVFAMNDEFTVGIDSTGESLIREDIRQSTTKAPISETLASAIDYADPMEEGSYSC